MIPRRDARRRQQVRRREEPARRRPRFRPEPARRRASPFASARRPRVSRALIVVFTPRASSRALELANQARGDLFASPPRVVSPRVAFETSSRPSSPRRASASDRSRAIARHRVVVVVVRFRRRIASSRRRPFSSSSVFASRRRRRRVVSRTRILACPPDRARASRASSVSSARLLAETPMRAVASRRAETRRAREADGPRARSVAETPACGTLSSRHTSTRVGTARGMPRSRWRAEMNTRSRPCPCPRHFKARCADCGDAVWSGSRGVLEVVAREQHVSLGRGDVRVCRRKWTVGVLEVLARERVSLGPEDVHESRLEWTFGVFEVRARERVSLERRTCAYAASNGHLECLKYAREHGCPWDEETCACAA